MYFRGYFLLILCFIVGSEAQSTSTVTVISEFLVTETTVVVQNTQTICIQPVNASTLCRRRRQFWVDHPIILSFDDDDEFDNFETHYQPEPVLRVEPTRLPVALSDIEGRSSNRRKNGRPYVSPPYKTPEIDPSFETNRPQVRAPEPIFAAQIAQLISYISYVASTIADSALGRVTTITSTVTKTTLSTFTLIVTTSTRTIVIGNCIPPGLTIYSTCPAGP